ncbi:MAG: hypothetical protein ABSG67_22675 [Thermoguttaceae bacterium]|jgi:hypothetical protein
MTFYEALEIACKNLSQLSLKFIGPPTGEGVYLSAAGDSYDGSRLILTDLIRQFHVKGEPIAMIPNRDNLVVAGSDDIEGLNAMLAMTTEALKEPRPISGIALRLDGDEWVPWLPDVSHSLYKEFQQLHLHSLGRDYAEQKDLLDKMNIKNGVDVFVATFSIIQAPDGKIFSYAVWAEGVVALLPETDMVVFTRRDGETAMVERQKALDEVGDLMERLEMYPPRYRVTGFPSEEQLAAMGNRLQK